MKQKNQVNSIIGGGSYRLKSIRKTALIFLLIITLISVILINKSEAKYQVGKVYEDIVSGNVKNDVADFNLVSIYINGEKSLDNKVPDRGYVLDLKNTKCTLNGEELSDITFEYKYGKVGVYGINASKTKCNIYFVDSPTKKIIESSLGKLDASHFSKMSCKNGTNNATHSDGNCGEETNGVYEEETSLGTTYYYRGTINNNWVKFGTTKDNLPIWWRIIRINEDGTVRMIYAGEGEQAPALTVQVNGQSGYWMSNSRGINDTNYVFNNLANSNAYVGYMYGTPNSDNYNAEHGYDLIDQNRQDELHDSDAKKAVDAWYQENMMDETQYLSGSTGFCGDRTLVSGYEDKGYGNLTTYYNGYVELEKNKIPSFDCSDSAHDLYTTRDNKGKGNGALTYPVGLITAGEVVFSGTIYGLNSNYGFWLTSTYWYWTISPYSIGGNTAGVLNTGNGQIWHGAVQFTPGSGIKPVVNLKPEYFKTKNRDGTINNPYIVEF